MRPVLACPAHRGVCPRGLPRKGRPSCPGAGVSLRLWLARSLIGEVQIRVFGTNPAPWAVNRALRRTDAGTCSNHSLILGFPTILTLCYRLGGVSWARFRRPPDGLLADEI